ncbi:ABC transporter permease [Gordonia malaquae]|uniref:ABC transporter permease n=1 Tax=Gordonia malaquae TaxID=410332 RepID=UPI0030C79E61
MSTTVRKLGAVVLGLSIAIPLVLLMFIGPASRGTPHEVPIGVAGPAAAVDQVSASLDQHQPGAFDVRGFESSDDLQDAARNREVYGGFVLGAQPQTIVATGGSPTVATMLTQIGTGLAAQSGAPAAPVVDVAPATDDDSRGAGFGSMVMPVFMAGVALGATAALVGRRRRVILWALPVGAAAVSAASIGVAMAVGVLGGGFVLQWLALAAGILAIAAPVAGLVRVVGAPGIGVAALLFMLVGMPLAGVSAPPEFLPSIWATVGQLLPLGATGTALRSAAFFDGAGSAAAFAVLTVWIVIGYLLLSVPKKTPEAENDGAAEVDELREPAAV